MFERFVRGCVGGFAAWATAGCLGLAGPALAQDPWPSQPIRVIVPYAPGGTTDLIARRMAEQLGKELAQTVIVENRPGASTNIGAQAVVKARPDGHTLLFGGVAQVLNPVFGPNPGFDLLGSLEPVSLVARVPFVVAANPKMPFNQPRELIAAAKAAPGALSISSAQLDLYVELLNTRAGMQLLHVPYKGGAPATTDAISGQVNMVFALVPVLLPHIQAGKLKALGVTSAQRFASLPEVPTFAEIGLDYDVTVWFALFAPSGTPKAVIDRLARSTQKIMGSGEMGQAIRADGAEPTSSRPEDLQAQLRAELAFWQQIAKAMPHLVQK